MLSYCNAAFSLVLTTLWHIHCIKAYNRIVLVLHTQGRRIVPADEIQGI